MDYAELSLPQIERELLVQGIEADVLLDIAEQPNVSKATFDLAVKGAEKRQKRLSELFRLQKSKRRLT